MDNPWELTRTHVFNIHPDDDDWVRQHNRRAKPDQQVQRSLPPVPFIGDPRTARVILLGKNPTYSEQDDADLAAYPDLEAENFKALTFESRFPFFYLDPAFAGTNAYRWWWEALQGLLQECGAAAARGGAAVETVLGRLAVVQWHPYHSKASFDPDPAFPTQRYGVHLVRQAAAGVWGPKLFVIQYGTGNGRLWRGQVPGLPADAITLNSPQSPHLSRGNLRAGDFDRLLDVLCAAPAQGDGAGAA